MSGGILGRSGLQGTTCTACHGGGNFGAVTSLIPAPGDTQLVPSEVGDYTIRITVSGAAATGGFNAAPNAGTLTSTDAGADNNAGGATGAELTHTTDRPFSAGQVQWTFRWNSPATEGSRTLYACGNATNNNGSTSGDQPNCTTLALCVCADSDGDELCDTQSGGACVLDACPLDNPNDPDGDGRCTSADNCPSVANPTQTDTDGDLIGDACDPCPAGPNLDSDGDGTLDCLDGCPSDPTATTPPCADVAIPAAGRPGLVLLALLLFAVGGSATVAAARRGSTLD
jgi:hypothetical protein